MTENRLAALVAVLWLGMIIARPLPAPLVLVAAVLMVSIGVAAKVLGTSAMLWPLAFLAVLVLASVYSARAWDQLVPVQDGSWEGEATLVSDPIGVPGGVRVRLQIEGHHVDARAWGGAAGVLRNRLMGEKVQVTGTTRPVDARSNPWLATRHITGRMTVTKAGGWRTGSTVTRFANSVRRTIESGATVMTRQQRSLFTGLVYGDDRLQSAVTADDFQAAGLTHLLAVSGQNVAFVLVLVGPMLRRFAPVGRFAAVLLVLFAFATLTRFEPSVLRACAMAAVAALSVVLGRPASSLRILALSIGALLVHDPLIAHAAAFQLSVAASLGILIISPQLAMRCRGPRLLVEAVTVTSGAQLGVAPLLLWMFNGLPVASLPANVLAGPASGPVMMWGVTGGIVAGLVPPSVADLLHVPTRWLLAWIAGVARIIPSLVPGQLGVASMVVLAVATLVFVVARQSGSRRLALVALGLLLLGATLRPLATSDIDQAIDDQSRLWSSPSGTVLALDSRTDTADLLAALRTARVDTVDLVVVRSGGYGTHAALSQLRARFAIHTVWAPEGHGLSGVIDVIDDQQVMMGEQVLTVQVQAGSSGPTLAVTGGAWS